MTDYKEAVILIGAACSFGYDIVSKLSRQFPAMVLTEHPDRYEQMSAAADDIRKRNRDTTVLCCRFDAACVNGFDNIICQMEENHLMAKAMVYCAGINALLPAPRVSEEIWDRILEVNLKGFFFSSRAAAGQMISHDMRGSIVAIASQHSVAVNYDRAPYCASKAGLVHLVREMALEYASCGIRFNAVSPSFILSESNSNLLLDHSFCSSCLDKIPLGRYADGRDVAGAVRFLLSDESSFVTGHNLIVDGGYTIRQV
ncbi:MAG: SDR family oxidoreductase [Parasporobacterium sp.]|nr:SDR family oxidoreductase [Parasporobacterium sp.]